MSQHWPEDRARKLEELWSKGLSANQVAIQLGAGITRNAVIGKVHRMGLSARGTVKRSNPGQFQMSRKARVKQRRLMQTAAQRAERAMKSQRATERAVNQAGPDLLRPADQLVHIHDLERHHCRAPYGEKPVLYCGLQAIPGTSWCEFHRLRFFNSVQPEGHRLYVQPRKWPDNTRLPPVDAEVLEVLEPV